MVKGTRIALGALVVIAVFGAGMAVADRSGGGMFWRTGRGRGVCPMTAASAMGGSMMGGSMMGGSMMGGSMMGGSMMGGSMMGGSMMGGCASGAAAAAAPAPLSGAREIRVDVSNFAFSPSTITVKAGEAVNVVLHNGTAIAHDLTIQSLGVRAVVQPGQDTTFGLKVAQPGTYPFLCSVPGHAQAGMKGTLTVERAA